MILDELAKKHDVCSFELSKELKEAGMPQDKSIWYWCMVGEPHLIILPEKGEAKKIRVKDYSPLDYEPIYIAAPHSGELAEMLPKGTWLNVFFHSLEVQVQYNPTKEICVADTLPNALARMVKYLLDKGIIKK